MCHDVAALSLAKPGKGVGRQEDKRWADRATDQLGHRDLDVRECSRNDFA